MLLNAHWRAAALALVCCSLLSVPAAQAAGRRPYDDGAPSEGRKGEAHTISWYCLDVNELLKLEVPIVVGRGVLVAPPSPPYPTPCTPTAFPVVVPSGSRFVVGGLALWFTNKTYPRPIREALEAGGYPFVAQSPVEDLMRKLTAIRIELRDASTNALVDTVLYDPRHDFRIRQHADVNGYWSPGMTPWVDPTLGLDLTVEEQDRLPLLLFPHVIGPYPPGQYVAAVSWYLDAPHNDGLGLEAGSFLMPGWNLYAQNRFVIAP